MDITDNTLDFNKVCRLCLTEETVMSSIYNEEDSETDSVPLPLRIMACVSVEVSSNDGLPSQICATCLCQVDGWYKFKDLCENSDLILRKCIKNEPVQIDSITQVRNMAQEVKKYFSSQVVKDESETANQNKNLSPKKKMASAITSSGSENMNPSLVDLHNYIETLESKNRSSGIRANYEIIFENVIEKPVEKKFSPKKSELVANCGQVEIYKMKSDKNQIEVETCEMDTDTSDNFEDFEFKVPDPKPTKRRYKKNLHPHDKWTNVNFDDPKTLRAVGVGNLHRIGHKMDEVLYISGDEEESEHVYEPDPKKFKFKNPIVEECIKKYEQLNQAPPGDGITQPKLKKKEGEQTKSRKKESEQSKRQKKESEQPKRRKKEEETKKSEKVEFAEIRKQILKNEPDDDTHQLLIDKCIYSFRLNDEGNLDIVDIIEDPNAQAKFLKGLGFNCIFCKEFQTGRQDYDKHVRKEHTKNLICKICDKQLYAIRSFLVHLAMHSGIYTFTCPVCGKNLPRSSSFTEHIKGHAAEKIFKCEICEKVFAKFANLKRHAVLHDKKKVFLCDMCGFGTHCKPNLEYHINSHLGQKDFMCEFCGKLFFSVKTLEYHVLTHTKPSFPCKYCKKKFRWAHKYENHLEKCHGEKVKGFEVVEEEIEPIYVFDEFE